MAEFLANDLSTTLNGAIADGSTTSITVTSGTGFPSVNFRIRIDDELMLVTSVGGGTDWTVTRGVEGTTGVAHSNGAAVYQLLTVAGLTQVIAGATAATVTTNANLTGHVTSSGNAAVLGSFTLAQLNTAINDADVATGGGTATGSNTGDQTITLSGAVTGTGTGAITTVMNSTLDSLTDVTSTAPVSGDVLRWSGTAWIPAQPTSVVGSASSFFLDATVALADNFTLSVSPSNYVETINTKTVLIATSPVFFERFVSGALGRDTIPAGTWTFETYAATDSDTSLNEVKFRINKRVAQTGMTGTFTGAGATRTFTVTGGTPFVAGDANASRLLAGLIETPTQTGWISAFTSSSEVTVSLSDAGFVNVAGVELSAIYYYLFDDTTGDVTGATPALYTTITVQPAFTGLNDTDRLVIAYFGSSDSDVGTDTMRLYYGGNPNFTHFDSPISTLHNDLAGLNNGDYKHLTAAQFTVVGNTSGTNTGDNSANTLYSGLSTRATVAATATTTPLWAESALHQDWTGTPTITNLPAAPQAGAWRVVYPAAGTILTDNANIDVQGDANYTFVAGDQLYLEALTTTTFKAFINKKEGFVAAVGGGGDNVFFENDQTVTVNYTLTTGRNAMSAGAITIDAGVTVTIPAGATWSVI